MSMQSFLLEFGASSLEDVMRTRYYAERTPPYAMRAISRLGYAWHQEFGVALRSYWHDLRTLPDLERGVKHQQYPQLGLAWPYIKRKHANDRKDKQRDYSKHSIIDSKGSGWCLRDGELHEMLSVDCGKYKVRRDAVRHPAESAAEKRIAKRINNKRRRAEEKREIAVGMGLWADDSRSTHELMFQEFSTPLHCTGYDQDAWLGYDPSQYSGNVFVPAAPECFKSTRVYGMPVPVDHYRVDCYSNGGDYIANVAKDYQ